GSGVFLLPDVTDQRLSYNPRARRNAAVIQVDDAARDSERILNDGPVILIHGRFFRGQMSYCLRRGFDGFQQRRDCCGRKRGQTEAFAGKGKKAASRPLTKHRRWNRHKMESGAGSYQLSVEGLNWKRRSKARRQGSQSRFAVRRDSVEPFRQSEGRSARG